MLGERTEGWIAALQLATLPIRGRDDVSSFIAGSSETTAKSSTTSWRRCWRPQPDAARSFLLQPAVLDRLSGPLCDAVTGVGSGSRTLEALDRTNLFVVALDDRREWYRYHRLFTVVLRARLLVEQPDQVPLLHRRASRWNQAHDQTEDAVGHALPARDLGRAAPLMELAVPIVRRQETTMQTG